MGLKSGEMVAECGRSGVALLGKDQYYFIRVLRLSSSKEVWAVAVGCGVCL